MPPSATDYAARQNGNLELARKKFAEVVKLEPKIPEGHEALGAILVELGKPADAIAEFEAAREAQARATPAMKPIWPRPMRRRGSRPRPFRTSTRRFTWRVSRGRRR